MLERRGLWVGSGSWQDKETIFSIRTDPTYAMFYFYFFSCCFYSYLSVLFLRTQDGYSVCIRRVTCVYMHVYVLLCIRCSCLSNKFMKSQAPLPRAQPTYHLALQVLICPSLQHPTKSVTFQRNIKKKKL